MIVDIDVVVVVVVVGGGSSTASVEPALSICVCGCVTTDVGQWCFWVTQKKIHTHNGGDGGSREICITHTHYIYRIQ